MKYNFEENAKALVLFLDEILKQKGKSRYWLSQQTGINEGTLSKYFNQDNIPSLPVYLKMLHALEINMFFEARDSNTELNQAFEEAMERLGRRPDKLPKN